MSNVVSFKSDFPPISDDGNGRPELRKYIVSRRQVAAAWPFDDLKAIRAARFKYNRGLAELATARDGDWLILYCIPRKKPAPSRDWFNVRSEN